MPRRRVRPSAPERRALLTLGRLPVALEIARALHGAGWRVVVAEPLPIHLCRVSRSVARCRTVPAARDDPAAYVDALARVVAEEGVSLVVPVSEEIVHVAGLHGRLPEDVALACPRRDALLALHDKWRFAERARELGLAVPETALASSAAGAAIASRGPHVVKPRLSCSGVGVTLHDAAGEIDPARRDARFVVQARLPGEALCVQALAIDGELRALVGYRSLLDAGSVSVVFERVHVPDAVRRLIERVVDDACWSGPIAFDLIADAAGGWQAIECNPRATSGLHLLPPALVAEVLTRRAGPARDRDRTGDPAPGTAHVPARHPDARAPIGARRQEFWSALAEVEGRTLRGRGRRADWARLLTTRDVDWSARDPLPFLTMVGTGAPLLWRALRARRPITEVTMADMGWHAAP